MRVVSAEIVDLALQTTQKVAKDRLCNDLLVQKIAQPNYAAIMA